MIVITGASSGLGLEIAKIYKNADKRVVNISLHECSVADDNFIYDLAENENIDNAVKKVLAIQEPIEVVINCIGIWGQEALDSLSINETEKLLAVNLKAPMLFLSGLLRRIRKDEADIVNIVSTAGRGPAADHAVYVASKWGERGYTDSLREELKDTMCRVIGFYPGGIKTKLFEKNLHNDITDDGTYWMDPAALAQCIKQLLDLPKGIEVTEIVLNRKKQFK